MTTNFGDVVPLLGAIVGCHCSVVWLGGRVTSNFEDVVPLLDAMAGCHYNVLWWVPLQGDIVVWYGGGRVTTNFGGVDVVPLLGAIVGCHCSVVWLGGRVTSNFEDVVPLLDAMAGCHYNVLWWVPLQGDIVVWYGGGRVTTNFGGVDVVPLLGAIAGCHSSVLWLGREGDDQLWEKWTCWVPLQGANLCFMSSFYIQGHQFHPGTQENNNEFCLEFLADVTFFSMY